MYDAVNAIQCPVAHIHCAGGAIDGDAVGSAQGDGHTAYCARGDEDRDEAALAIVGNEDVSRKAHSDTVRVVEARGERGGCAGGNDDGVQSVVAARGDVHIGGGRINGDAEEIAEAGGERRHGRRGCHNDAHVAANAVRDKQPGTCSVHGQLVGRREQRARADTIGDARSCPTAAATTRQCGYDARSNVDGSDAVVVRVRDVDSARRASRHGHA